MDIEKTNIMEIIKINGIEYKKSPNGVFLIRKEEKTDPKKQGDIYVKKEMFDQLDEKTKYLFNTYMEKTTVDVPERTTRSQKHSINLNHYYYFKVKVIDEFEYDLTLKKDNESNSRNDCLVFAEKLGILMSSTIRKKNETTYSAYDPEKEEQKKGISRSVFKNNSSNSKNRNKLGTTNVGNFISLVREFDYTLDYDEASKILKVKDRIFMINPEIGDSYILMKYLYNNNQDPDYNLWRKIEYETSNIWPGSESLIAKTDDEFILYPIDTSHLEKEDFFENIREGKEEYYELDPSLLKLKQNMKNEEGNCIIIDEKYCIIPMYNEYKLDLKEQGGCPYHAACVIAKDDNVNITLEADLGDKKRIFPVFDMYEVSCEKTKKPHTFYGRWMADYSYTYPKQEKFDLSTPKIKAKSSEDSKLINKQKLILKETKKVLPILLHAVVDLIDNKKTSIAAKSTCQRCTRSTRSTRLTKNATSYVKRKSGIKSLSNIRPHTKVVRKTQSERKRSKSKTQKSR